MKRLLILLLLVGILFSATPITSCQVISSSGEYYLANDLSHSGSGACINITADNVVLDGRGHTITGDGNGYGICLYGDRDTIENATIKGFYRGFDADSYWCRIYGNVVQNNYIGVYLWGSSEFCWIYNNFLNNTYENGYPVSGHTNYWSKIPTQGTNIVGGNLLGGNFYAKPDGLGFSETCCDKDEDGICGRQYKIADKNIDYLPLTFAKLKIIFSPHSLNTDTLGTHYITVNYHPFK